MMRCPECNGPAPVGLWCCSKHTCGCGRRLFNVTEEDVRRCQAKTARSVAQLRPPTDEEIARWRQP